MRRNGDQLVDLTSQIQNIESALYSLKQRLSLAEDGESYLDWDTERADLAFLAQRIKRGGKILSDCLNDTASRGPYDTFALTTNAAERE